MQSRRRIYIIYSKTRFLHCFLRFSLRPILRICHYESIGDHLGFIKYNFYISQWLTYRYISKYEICTKKSLKVCSFKVCSFQLWHFLLFDGGHLGFEFWASTSENSAWHPIFLKSAYSKTPIYQISCFLPEVHNYFTYPPHYFKCCHDFICWKWLHLLKTCYRFIDL